MATCTRCAGGRKVDCPDCRGARYVGFPPAPCRTCKKAGQITCPVCDGSGKMLEPSRRGRRRYRGWGWP